MKWIDSEVPPSQCVECGKKMDMASGRGATPEPGDFTLCIRCGSLNVFDVDLTLRRPTLDEYVESTHNREIQRLRKAILHVMKECSNE